MTIVMYALACREMDSAEMVDGIRFTSVQDYFDVSEYGRIFCVNC